MSEADSELQWQELSGAWSAAPSTPVTGVDELRRRSARHRRRQALVVAGEIALVIAFAALTAMVVAGGVEAWHVVWLASLWGFTAVALAFGWWNRRATWRASADSVDAFVRLARLRAERGLRSLRFALVLFAAEVVVVVAQLLWFERLVPWALAVLGAAGVALLGWCVVAGRRLRGELARIAAFEGELTHGE
jgi:hypothetical protein